MPANSIYILGVRIDPVTIKQLNHLIINHIHSGRGELVIFKPYVEFLSLAARNDRIRDLLNKSDINAADSIAVQWAASYLYGSPPVKSNSLSTLRSLLIDLQKNSWRTQVVPQRMAGVDQTLPLLKRADKLHLRVGILGGPKDIEQTRRAIEAHFANIQLNIWSGYYAHENEKETVRAIGRYRPDILFCAMGFPKQEKFIIKYRSILGAKVIIGEGGSFDYDQLGGRVRRAPEWLRKLGLEWLWRLMLQPRRVIRQISIPVFIKKVQKQRKMQK